MGIQMGARDIFLPGFSIINFINRIKVG